MPATPGGRRALPAIAFAVATTLFGLMASGVPPVFAQTAACPPARIDPASTIRLGPAAQQFVAGIDSTGVGYASLVTSTDVSSAASVVGKLPMLRTDVWSREGLDDTGWAVRVETDARGNRTVHSEQGRRLELFLDPMLRAACGSYEGHLLSGGVAAPLPAGTSLDARHGIFRWQPATEFTGTYPFVFVHHGCDGVERRIPVVVIIGRR